MLPLVVRSRRVRAQAFRFISQLAIRYRHSRLSVDGASPPSRGPKPGDRIPDAPVTEGGRSGTLHGAIAGPGLHLLLCGPSAGWPDAVVAELADRYRSLTVSRLTAAEAQGAVHDHTGLALLRLGVRHNSPAHFLIRPDGHVAYRNAGADLSGLQAYLERWFAGGRAPDAD